MNEVLCAVTRAVTPLGSVSLGVLQGRLAEFAGGVMTLLGDSSRLSVDRHSWSLVIAPVQTADSGHYSCSVNGQTSRRRVVLVVLGESGRCRRRRRRPRHPRPRPRPATPPAPDTMAHRNCRALVSCRFIWVISFLYADSECVKLRQI